MRSTESQIKKRDRHSYYSSFAMTEKELSFPTTVLNKCKNRTPLHTSDPLFNYGDLLIQILVIGNPFFLSRLEAAPTEFMTRSRRSAIPSTLLRTALARSILYMSLRGATRHGKGSCRSREAGSDAAISSVSVRNPALY
jgi:hypothetical protein